MDCYLPPFQLKKKSKYKFAITFHTRERQQLNKSPVPWVSEDDADNLEKIRDYMTSMQPLEIHCKELSQWVQETFTMSWQKTFTETK